MVKARTWFTLFIISLLTIAATASCGSDEATGGGGGAGGMGAILTAGTSSGRAGGSGVTSNLGLKCSTDAQCGTGFVCATASGSTIGSGGPQDGMCTLACQTSNDCEAVQPGAACFNFGTDSATKLYCLAACQQGGDASALPTKCQGRDDFACIDLRDAATSNVPDPFCLPLCTSDEKCGAGLFCNKGSGLCTKTKPTGDPVGTDCNPAATTDTCEGFCIRTTADGVTPQKGTCTEFCAGFFDCQYKGSKPGGLCGGPLSDTFGVLDLGYCLPSCNCTGDCTFPGDLCRKWVLPDESSIATSLGTDGLCYPQVSDSVELSCGEGGAGGTGGAGGESAGGAAGSTDTGAAGAIETAGASGSVN